MKERRDWVCEVVLVVGVVAGREARFGVVGSGVKDVGSLVPAGTVE